MLAIKLLKASCPATFPVPGRGAVDDVEEVVVAVVAGVVPVVEGLFIVGGKVPLSPSLRYQTAKSNHKNNPS